VQAPLEQNYKMYANEPVYTDGAICSVCVIQVPKTSFLGNLWNWESVDTRME
jgi:hypothetical protein